MENTKQKRFKSKPLGENQGKILVCLPQQMYADFKAYCGFKGTNMAEAVRQMITDKLSA